MYCGQRIGVVIPARNEQAAIGLVVTELLALQNVHGEPIVDQLVVADNGSSDDTAKQAKAAGAQVVFEATAGYGHACLKAVSALENVDVLVFIDGDHAFYAAQLPLLLDALTQGAHFVFGSRTLGLAQTGALMPQQQWGNKLAVTLIRIFWGHQYTDLGPFRVMRRDLFDALNMQELTYGWTVEMQIKALQAGFQVIETPVDTRVRIGQSKVSGTLKGSIGAGIGILSAIAKLRWRGIPSSADLG